VIHRLILRYRVRRPPKTLRYEAQANTQGRPPRAASPVSSRRSGLRMPLRCPSLLEPPMTKTYMNVSEIPVLKPYFGRKTCLATKHGKEKVVARPFRHALGVEIMVPADLDTDSLGTFSNEIPRLGKPLDVCFQKARMGMAAAGLPFGIANEGSFGPHPSMPFIASDYEIIAFVDDERGFSIHETLFSLKTNYAHREVCGPVELDEWLQAVKFPSHGLIVQPKSDNPQITAEKGIVSLAHLRAAIARATARSERATALVATDMRAHFNPTRMALIRRLAFRMARRLATPCPSCQAPGWGMTGQSKGLPCKECGMPTEMILSEIFTCTACTHREERPRLDGLREAPIDRCPCCNP